MNFFRLLHDNDIIRRYIVMNSFDGTLTSLGILIAMKLSNITDVKLIVISAIGVIFATGISGVWGAYLVEKAELKHELAELHRLSPKEDLEERRREFKQLTILMGIANGASSALIGLVIISPFFMASIGTLSVSNAVNYSFFLVFLALILIGSFTARIAREPVVKHAIMTILAGLFVGAVIYLFELLKFI